MKKRTSNSPSIDTSIISAKVLTLMLALIAVFLSIEITIAGRLPDTAANRARGVVGCTQTSSGITCPNRGGRSGSSGYGGLSPSDQMMLNTMQGLINNFQSGYKRGLEIRRQRAIQQQQERKRLQLQRQEQERVRKKKEKQRRQQFIEAKARMLGHMRNPQTDVLQPRNLGSLDVQEVGNVFGTKTLKPRDLSASTPLPSAKSSSTTWLQKANCSVYLLNKANKAAAKGQFQEAAYLSNEAAELSSGAKASPAVVCPPLQEVPDVKGMPVPESQAMAEKIEKQTILYSKLFSRAVQQMENHRTVLHSVKQAEEKVAEKIVRKKEAETNIENINNQRPLESESEKKSVMAEALAALEKAKTALAESEQALAEEKKSQQQMENQLSKTRNMFKQVKESPEKMARVMRQLNAGTENAGGKNER